MRHKGTLFTAAMAVLLAGPASAAIQVEVNGQPMYFGGVQPTQIGGRVFLPLRQVAESLGADVRWDSYRRTVHGTRDGRTFSIPIGSTRAEVGGSAVHLDAPARIVGGTTLVPLRFAAEALGADVAWNPGRRLVAINLPGGSTVAGDRQTMVTVPADTVVRVELEEGISSKSAREGDRFTARLDEADRSRFPIGTRFEGRIVQVQRSSKEQPGIIDMSFDRALLPDGTSVAIQGGLATLNKDHVERTADGRLVARKVDGKSKFDWKWVGYGAAGGAVLGQIFGGALLKGALLGGVGGAIYSYLNKDKKDQFRDVELEEGADFGIQLQDRVAFAERDTYTYP
jgi:hypothetical protein